MKKVLFLDHASVAGGAQLVLVNYLRYLPKDKFRVVVACSNSEPYLVAEFKKYADKVYVIPFDRLKALSLTSIYGFVRSVLAVLKIIKEEGIELIVCNTERAVYVGTIASIISGVKVLWFIRDFMYSKFLFSLLMPFASMIIFVSKSIQDFYSVYGAKAHIMHVCSDMYSRLTKVKKKDIDAFKKNFKLKNKIVIGYVGRIVRWKGLEVLIKSMPLVKNKNVVCLIAGDFDRNESAYKDEIYKLVKLCRGRVVFAGFRKDIDVVLKSCDIFVHPALEKEPYATSIVEALMAKLPVVATNLGGTPEIISDKNTGILIEPNDPQALANKINYLLENKSMAKKLATSGYLRVMKKNKIEEEIEKLTGIFNSL